MFLLNCCHLCLKTTTRGVTWVCVLRYYKIIQHKRSPAVWACTFKDTMYVTRRAQAPKSSCYVIHESHNRNDKENMSVEKKMKSCSVKWELITQRELILSKQRHSYTLATHSYFAFNLLSAARCKIFLFKQDKIIFLSHFLFIFHFLSFFH